MTSMEPDLTLLEQKAQQYFIQGDYSQAASYYKQGVEAEPEVKSHYWNLGLILLLQRQEVQAQTTWKLGMTESEPQQVEQWIFELMQVLQREAERREMLAEYAVAWIIRQSMQKMAPADLSNLLYLIELAVKLKTFTSDKLTTFGVIDLIKSDSTVNIQLLLRVLESILNYATFQHAVLEFVEASLAYIHEPQSFFNILIPATIRIAHSERQPKIAARLLELGLRLESKNLEVLRHLASFYLNAGEYFQGIETAKMCYSLSDKLPEQLTALHLVHRGLMDAPDDWQEAYAVLQQQESLLTYLIKEQPRDMEASTVLRMFNSNYFAPYLRDDPHKNRQTQNQIAQLCQLNVQNYASEQFQRYRQRTSAGRTKLVKIGYLSHSLCIHSVGWLARWLFQYHDRARFQIYAYFINSKQADPLQKWYTQHVTKAYNGGIDGKEIAEQIYQDEIDILIDLDSITIDVCCEIMALKPAPVQVTWLGWDASGLPAVDYFIADPYVLPESAEEYYVEKIWRLPQTYIAVDGFEVGVPTLRRDNLNIPDDAVVYLSAQRGFKRHPDTARLQMKIIKSVPNSYFLIKGFAKIESVQKFFLQLAQEEGVASDRLRFLPSDPTEAFHRANLMIADVVLDTYPYNGATTTLETLWMGIPIVTRVGQQFAARNSYTMMMNTGITEGIAWTDEEYVEWGIRLGKDATLRQQISWKLRHSRQSAPLWNAKQFTHQIQKAYEQMWQRYLEGF
ncbi:MAG: O-linked N-acetylglucosamine transferase, SPINDLY family protein [Nostoc sp. LPT]|nr:O-linked N-acetylglucosamine transferase, SPINDLY family protein [Nostoc sp. LPT]